MDEDGKQEQHEQQPNASGLKFDFKSLISSNNQQKQELKKQPSRIAFAATGLGGLRESLFSVVLGSVGTSHPEIEFTLPPCTTLGTPTFTRRSPATELGGSSPDISISGPSSRATSPCNLLSPRASPCSSTNELRVTGFPLGSLNPALYKSTEGDDSLLEQKCKILLSLTYDETQERLHIILKRAFGLNHVFTLSQEDSCIPVARICLLPDERRYQQTKLRKRTSNPNFNEEFCFHISAKEIEERSLRIFLFDVEKKQRERILGQVTLPLKDLQLSTQQREFQLEVLPPGAVGTTCPGPCPGPCRGQREAGVSLLLALSFIPALERLNVSILEARLTQTSSLEGSDLYGKASLVQQARAVKSKRTTTVKKVNVPGTTTFNESFSFNIAQNTLDTCSLAVHIMKQETALTKDQSVGRVVIGSNMFARGSGLEHWRRMLAAPTERIQQWHCLLKGSD